MKGGRAVRLAPVSILACFVAGAAAAKPPSWDRKIDSPERFGVLKPFASEAVLDRAAGLVDP